jgi:hypothetical protein
VQPGSVELRDHVGAAGDQHALSLGDLDREAAQAEGEEGGDRGSRDEAGDEHGRPVSTVHARKFTSGSAASRGRSA